MGSHQPRIAEGFPGERLTIVPPAALQRARRIPLCRDLCVTHTGRFDRVHGHFVDRPEGRPEHVLIVCLDGAGSCRIGPSRWRLERGHGVVLPPGIPHQYASDEDDPWSIFWFHFVGARAADYVEALNVTRRHARFWVHEIDQLIEGFEECHRYVLGGYTDSDLIGLTTSFARLLGLCRTLQRSRDLRRRHAEDRVLRSIRFMRENLQRPLTLGALASEAGFSIPHFSAIFRRQMNCGPIEFLNRLKLQKACELLHTTELGVAEIAYSTGYEDPLYFSRTFRQHIGVSPREFRRASGKAGRGQA